MTDRELTSYCGLWCNDCIPSNERLYSLTSELRALLHSTGFENYAALKSKRVAAFEEYDRFLSVLDSFKTLHCFNYCRKGPCSEAGCAKDCEIRICVLAKSLDGCWDCDSYSACEHIGRREKLHPDIKHNLAMIKKHGIDHWKYYRGRHYNWSE